VQNRELLLDSYGKLVAEVGHPGDLRGMTEDDLVVSRLPACPPGYLPPRVRGKG